MNKKSIKKIIAAFLICCMGMVGVWTDEAEAGTYELEYDIFNPNYGRIFYKPADAEFLALRIKVGLSGGARYNTTRVIAGGVEVGSLYPPTFGSPTESFTSNTIVIPAGTQQVVISPLYGDIIDMSGYGQWGSASAVITYSRASGMSELNEIKNSINTVSTKLNNMDTKVTSTQTTANNVLTQINNTTYGLSALNTKINELKNNSATKTDITNLQKTINSLQETMAPIIISIKGRNGATATTSTTISVDVTASNATHYRAGVNGNYTTWQESPNIDRILLPNSGVNTIEVQARRGISEEAPITKGYLTVFRL